MDIFFFQRLTFLPVNPPVRSPGVLHNPVGLSRFSGIVAHSQHWYGRKKWGEGGRKGGRGRKVGEGSMFCNPHFTSWINITGPTSMIHMLGIFMTEDAMEKKQTPQTLQQRDQTFGLCTVHLYQCYGTWPTPWIAQNCFTSCWLPVGFLSFREVEL